MSGLKPQNVHVLFVHGVGAHAPLSSLLQAYQSLRSNTRSPEAPAKGDVDPIDAWRLQKFSVGAPTARLKLVQPGAQPGDTRAVFLYEVNYSALASVVRRNHEIDLTALFVSFDLAVNVARLRFGAPRNPSVGFAIRHQALAEEVQKLAGVFVAATVPILGIPSLVFKRFTRNLVSVFTRFFEDITTFALDPNGESLISRHVDQTVRSIVESDDFRGRSEKKQPEAGHAPDLFVIAGHSLGSIVTHSYLVRHRQDNVACLPDKVLTFGSPIGIVSWLWLFLDFAEMDFTDENLTSYFTWAPLPKAPAGTPPLQWINVVNHLDPIATAFPIDYVDLAGSPAENAATLSGGQLHQRFIRCGSAWSGHTSYFEDREGFLEILGRLARLQPLEPEDVRNPNAQPPDPAARPRETHWREADADLERLSRRWWLGGFAALLVYLGGISWLCRSGLPMIFLLAYAWPWLTIGTLAYFQRLIYSRPSKRTSIEAIKTLRRGDIRARPHFVRQRWRGELSPTAERAFVDAPRPGWWKKTFLWLVSFLPTLTAMALPILAAWAGAEGWEEGWKTFWEHPTVLFLFGLGLFTGYLICYAISEFLAHWREAMKISTR